MKKKPKYFHEFTTQKNKASQRGILWKLSFKEWLTIWKKSGKLLLRGKGTGKYCLARFGDKGPYSRINVFVQLFTDNWITGRHREAKHKRKIMVPIAQIPEPNWFT